MEGMSIINYKGLEIFHVSYAVVGSNKEKTLQLIKTWEEALCKYPPKSAICLTNVTGLGFDKEILNAIKSAQDKTTPYIKRTAVYGMKPIHKAAYNFVLAMTTSKFMKVFDTEEQAKEWLVKE